MPWFNEQTCQWFAVSMLHLLWQALIPFAIWLACNRWFASHPQHRYAIGILALATIAACLPLNLYCLRPSTTASLSQALRSGPNTSSTTLYVPPSHVINASVQHPPTGTPSVELFTPTAERPAPSTALLSPNIYPWLVSLYLLGVAFFSIRMVRGSWQTWQLRRRSQAIIQPHVLQAIFRATSAARLAIAPSVRWCDAVAVPALVGVLKPVILLPLHCATELSIDQLEQIVLHELTHFRRHDPLLNMLQNLIEALLFFHPLVWYISRQVRLDRELACDQAVIAAGHQPADYALSLVQIAARCKQHHLSPLVGMASTGRPSQLQIRIHSLFNQPQRMADGGLHLVCGMLILCILLAASTQMLSKAEAQDAAPTERVQTNGNEAAEKPAPTKELSGIVVDHEGKPIAGAVVDVMTFKLGDIATTDDRGHFHLPITESQRTVELSISKDGYSPYYQDWQEVGVEMKVTLAQDTFIEGIVRDPSGEPAANVEIIAHRLYPNGYFGEHLILPVILTKSDSSGRYRLHLAPDVDYDVKLRLRGVGTGRGTIGARFGTDVAPGGHVTVDWYLTEPIRFEARLIDGESKLPRSGVTLFSQNPFIEGTSDDSGNLVIEDMWPGQVTFEVGEGKAITKNSATFYEPTTLGRWWSQQANIWSRERINGDYSFQYNFNFLIFDLSAENNWATIELEQAAHFRGTVYDPDGNPIAGATVSPVLTGSATGLSYAYPNRYRATTDANGKYDLMAPAGKIFRYNLMAHDGPLGQWRKWANGVNDAFESHPGEIKDNVDIRLNRPATVRGRIVESDDRSCEGSKIAAYAADKNEAYEFNPTTTVRADGTFELNFLREGKHEIQLETSGTPVSVDVQAGQVLDGIELDMPKLGERSAPELAFRRFNLTLRDASGQPAPHHNVFILDGVLGEWPFSGAASTFETKWRMIKSRSQKQYTTNVDGQFELDGVRVFAANNTATLFAYDDAAGTCAIYQLYADVRNLYVTMQMKPLRRVNLDLLNSSPDNVEVSLQFDQHRNIRIPPDHAGALQQIYLPPGNYRLSKRKLTAPVGDPQVPPTYQDFTVPDEDDGEPVNVKVFYGHTTKNTQAR